MAEDAKWKMPTSEHESAMQELHNWEEKYLEHLPPNELLALAAHHLGRMAIIAKSVMSDEQIGKTVAINFDAGQRFVVHSMDESESYPHQ